MILDLLAGSGPEQAQAPAPTGGMWDAIVRLLDRFVEAFPADFLFQILLGVLLVLVWAALAVLGVVIGVFTTSCIKLGWRALKGEPKNGAEKYRRGVAYRFMGMIFGAAWTLLLEYSLLWLPGFPLFLVATGTALVAGGLTPRAYDLWHNAIEPWIGRRFSGPTFRPGSTGMHHTRDLAQDPEKTGLPPQRNQ